LKGNKNRHGDATEKNTKVEIQVMTLIKEERQDHIDIVRVEN
jgi:hypothetical protein